MFYVIIMKEKLCRFFLHSFLLFLKIIIFYSSFLDTSFIITLQKYAGEQKRRKRITMYRRMCYEVVATTKNNEMKNLWFREYHASLAGLREFVIAGKKRYESRFDYGVAGEDDFFTEIGTPLPFVTVEDCCSVFVGKLTEIMKFVLKESNLKKSDIKTISYAYENCRGIAADSYYDEVIDRSNAKEILENIKENKQQLKWEA